MNVYSFVGIASMLVLTACMGSAPNAPAQGQQPPAVAPERQPAQGAGATANLCAPNPITGRASVLCQEPQTVADIGRPVVDTRPSFGPLPPLN